MARSKKSDAIQVINNETEEIREVNIYDLTRDAYLTFGRYVNNWRQLPQIIDGLKISYRRLLYSALTYPQGKMVKSVMLLGKLSEIHPHNTESSYSTLCNYVKSGIFTGQGSFGTSSIKGDNSPAAAPRYTESRVSDNYYQIIGRLIKKVPYVESPVGPLEPTYIPTVVPMSLCLKSDTKVMLANGRDLTMEELDKEYREGKELILFTYGIRGGRFIKSKVIWSGKTKTTNKYVRITLSNGSIVEATEDHRFLNINDEYVEAKDLRIGERMVSGPRELCILRITKIEHIEDESPSDFYDITVSSRYHNFVLSAGIVAHNCLDSLISGIGLGIATDLPNFSAKSMYEAFMHDDPNLLEPNIDIEMDKSRSELHKLWNEGRGKVCYKYRVSRIKGPDGNPGILLEGDAGIFVPKLKKIKDWEADGKVYIEDMVTQDGSKLAIYKVPNIKSINMNDIEEEVNKISANTNTYSLNVSDGGSAFRIPLREWIKATYTNYRNLIIKDNLEEIDKVKFDIKVYSNIGTVANYILNVNPKADNDEIIKATGLEPEVVSSIMTRTISTLRKTKDQTEKVRSLKEKLKELKEFDPTEFINSIVAKL